MEQKTGKDAEQKKDEKPHVVKVRKDKDGTIYAFNEEHQVWMPEVDADDIQAQQSAYQYVDPDKAPPAPSAEAKPKDANKRKRTKKRKRAPNRGVYVSGLPPDAKNEDIYRIFSKAGIILKDPETGIPKIVVYRDDEGKCKGDAIVTFFRPESVALAIELLDDSFFDQKCKLKVEEVTYDQKDTKKKKTGGIKKSQKNKRYDQSKELSWKEVEKLHVILKHMFTPEESLENIEFFRELENDIAQEAIKCGELNHIKVFENNPEGVVALKFATQWAAEKCIELMSGRFFGGRSVVAEFYDGFTDYDTRETEEFKKLRDERWGKYLAEKKAQAEKDAEKDAEQVGKDSANVPESKKNAAKK